MLIASDLLKMEISQYAFIVELSTIRPACYVERYSHRVYEKIAALV